MLGVPTRWSKGCRVIRLTLQDDVASEAGLRKATKAVQQSNTLLWASIPCTGGSPWQNLNQRTGNGRKRIAEHKRLFRLMWKSFVIVARACRKAGGQVAIEWPLNGHPVARIGVKSAWLS